MENIKNILDLISKFEDKKNNIEIYLQLIIDGKITLNEEISKYILGEINDISSEVIGKLEINLDKHYNVNNNTINTNSLDNTLRYGIRLIDNVISFIEDKQGTINNDRFLSVNTNGLDNENLINEKEKLENFISNRTKFWSFKLGKERGNFNSFENSLYDLNGSKSEEAVEFYSDFLSAKMVDKMKNDGKFYMRNKLYKEDEAIELQTSEKDENIVLEESTTQCDANTEVKVEEPKTETEIKTEKVEQEEINRVKRISSARSNVTLKKARSKEEINNKTNTNNVEELMMLSLKLSNGFAKHMGVNAEDLLDKAIECVLKNNI